MFKTETHLHVSEISRCAKLSAEQMMQHYADAGYHTVFVSDHYYAKFFEESEAKDWADKVHDFFRGYRNAAQAGKALGITVLPSVELCFQGAPNHYLVYGDIEDFLVKYPRLWEVTIEEFAPMARQEGMMVIQAHPHRDGHCYPTPEYVDGFETYNSNPRHEDYSERSEHVRQECEASGAVCYGIGGSDAHRPEDVGGSGILSAVPVEIVEDFLRLIKDG
ncbi:MAG: hypothetical protein IJ512_07750, partial [Ruminococcus sp.]|nr:hypothetical protein [Ruminococcus sp.]